MDGVILTIKDEIDILKLNIKEAKGIRQLKAHVKSCEKSIIDHQKAIDILNTINQTTTR